MEEKQTDKKVKFMLLFIVLPMVAKSNNKVLRVSQVHEVNNLRFCEFSRKPGEKFILAEKVNMGKED